MHGSLNAIIVVRASLIVLINVSENGITIIEAAL